MYLDKLEQSVEQLDDIISELETTYGGEKYLDRLRQLRTEMLEELPEEEEA